MFRGSEHLRTHHGGPPSEQVMCSTLKHVGCRPCRHEGAEVILKMTVDPHRESTRPRSSAHGANPIAHFTTSHPSSVAEKHTFKFNVSFVQDRASHRAFQDDANPRPSKKREIRRQTMKPRDRAPQPRPSKVHARDRSVHRSVRPQGRVARDQLRHDAAHRLNASRAGGDVELRSVRSKARRKMAK